MKDQFKKSEEEEGLTSGILKDQMREDPCPEHPIEEDEGGLTSEIQRQINQDKKILDIPSKQFIGKKIVQSIDTFKRKRLIFRVSAAAILLVIVATSVLFQINGESRIRQYAEENRLDSFENYTRLLLSGDQEIQINTDASKIKYTGNGNTIRIDASEEVIQEVKSDEMVFNTVIVPYGKRTQITLSDNSTIWMNSGSKLIYPARFAPGKREVYLEGEAIFEISPDKRNPFHVITSNVEVKVLGTIFNLSAYKDDPTVRTVLEKGAVELKYSSNSIFGTSKVTMVPGMLATYYPLNMTIDQTQVSTSYYTSWRDGYFMFKNESLGIIVKKISRYYNVSIQFNNQEMANETFSGQLDLGNSAYQVLEVIAEIMNAKVDSVGNHLLISKI